MFSQFSNNFKVGYSVKEITPSSKELSSKNIYMGGYGDYKERGPANDIHTPIWVRTLILKNHHTVILLAVLDVTGISNKFRKRLVSEISKATSLDSDNIIIISTHTHSGPDFQGQWGGVGEDYRNRVIEEVTKSSVTAMRNITDVYLKVTKTAGKAYNRRELSCTDSMVLLMSFIKESTGEPFVHLLNFTAHPVILKIENRSISSDYVHFLRETLETELKAPVVFTNGALGDIDPDTSECVGDNFSKLEKYGKDLATLISSQLRYDFVSPQLKLKHSYFDVPVENNNLLQSCLNGILDYDLHKKDQKESSWYINTRVSLVEVGDFKIILVPGEPLSLFEKYIHESLDIENFIIMGLAHDSLGYIIPSKVWMKGKHQDIEESKSISRDFEKILRDKIIHLI